MTVNGILSPNVDFAQLVAVSGDAIVVADADGAITCWNAAAERIFGFSASEAIGQSLDLITPDRHRRRHWDGYHKTMRSGHTKYGHDVLRVPATDQGWSSAFHRLYRRAAARRRRHRDGNRRDCS